MAMRPCHCWTASGLRGIDAEPHALALGVEGVEVDVGDDAQRAVGRGVGEGGEVLVGELASAAAAGGVGGGRGGGEGWGGGHGPAFVIASSSNGLLCGSKLFLESCSAWERDDVVAFNPFIQVCVGCFASSSSAPGNAPNTSNGLASTSPPLHDAESSSLSTDVDRTVIRIAFEQDATFGGLLLLHYYVDCKNRCSIQTTRPLIIRRTVELVATVAEPPTRYHSRQEMSDCQHRSSRITPFRLMFTELKTSAAPPINCEVDVRFKDSGNHVNE